MEKVLGLLEKKTTTTSPGNFISFKAGEYVMKEGDLSTDIFYVKEGTLQILKQGPNGSIETMLF
jgi:CRP-like cAMP-binding protein